MEKATLGQIEPVPRKGCGGDPMDFRVNVGFRRYGLLIGHRLFGLICGELILGSKASRQVPPGGAPKLPTSDPHHQIAVRQASFNGHCVDVDLASGGEGTTGNGATARTLRSFLPSVEGPRSSEVPPSL